MHAHKLNICLLLEFMFQGERKKIDQDLNLGPLITYQMLLPLSYCCSGIGAEDKDKMYYIHKHSSILWLDGSPSFKIQLCKYMISLTILFHHDLVHFEKRPCNLDQSEEVLLPV